MYTAKCDYYLPYLFTLIRNPWLPVEPKSPPMADCGFIFIWDPIASNAWFVYIFSRFLNFRIP